MEVTEVAELLNQTLSPDGNVVHLATEALDRLSALPHFPFSLLSICNEGTNQGQRIAAATYLKNFARRNIAGANGFVKIVDRQNTERGDRSHPLVSKEFKDQLMRTLLLAEHAVLRVLVETFRMIVVAEFVNQNSWPELVPELRSAIQNSNVVSCDANCQWSTLNSLVILQALLKPFQYFLDPKVAKEPVPPQLELIAKEILAPLLAVFSQLVEKALANHCGSQFETEKILHIVCKCMYFSVRSYMPSALVPILPSFCNSLNGILRLLNWECGDTEENGYALRLKIGKRSLQIFCALITRHRKYSDKLMPNIINSVLKIVQCSSKVIHLGFLSERIVSLAFDVASRVLETGPGWRLVSPHFSFLLESAIFPALVLNEKDISEWEEDANEFIQKNLPVEFEGISGWREGLFTARKSAINLLGVISMSKGPPVGRSNTGSSASWKRKKDENNKRNNQRNSIGELLVLPFLSKFPIPSDANAFETRIYNNYFGVLMAYGGLQDFLREQKPMYRSTLVHTRLLPLLSVSVCSPYLVAAASWVLGELATCLPEQMSADVYSSLFKALTIPDMGNISCYPVRVSAAGAVSGLLLNDYLPPEWLPLIQVVIGRIVEAGDEEKIILFQLLISMVEGQTESVVAHIPHMVLSLVDVVSNLIHHSLEPWPQVVVRGFEALAVIAQSWKSFMPEEKKAAGQAAISKALSSLLQQAWLIDHRLDQEGELSPASSCIEDSSALLQSIMLSVTGSNVILELKLLDLLLVWADMIAEWHGWEESDNKFIFYCIREVVSLHSKYGLKNFIVNKMPSPPAPPVPKRSIIESIGAFVSEAIFQYDYVTRACSCVHLLLNVPNYSFEAQCVKQSLAIVFSRAAFRQFRGAQIKPSLLWKPLLLALSSCYMCSPDTVTAILNKEEVDGFVIWASALASLFSPFELAVSTMSEIKLIVMTLVKVVEWLLEVGHLDDSLLQDCFTSLIESAVRLERLHEEQEDEGADGDDDDDDDDGDDVNVDDDDDDDDEDSESDEREETEEEFLERYAQAAFALENDSEIEEGDAEDQEYQIELGALEEVDGHRMVSSLIERCHRLLVPGLASRPLLIAKFLDCFPEFSSFFQQ